MIMRIDPLDLRRAEEIFIDGEEFDNERKKFINNMDTVDLLAVPGSGKTTALLAKLFCLAKQMPLDKNQGVLVLSHTNHAIEEIEKILKPLCPQLFSYPNFVGTVQSFANKFVANQACFELYGSYIHKNDDEIFFYEAESFFRRLVYSPRGHQPQSLKSKLLALVNAGKNVGFPEAQINVRNFLKSCSFNLVERKITIGNQTKLKYGGVTEPYYIELEQWKLSLLSQGILSYKDTFDVSKRYINQATSNEFKAILQHRFKHVFIDEMQDLDFDQAQLIEDIFFTDDSETVIQRIGDRNQAIYSSSSLNTEEVWKTRNEIDPERFNEDLSLNNSHRLTPIIGSLVDGFVLNRNGSYKVVGCSNRNAIAPHLLVYKDESEADRLKEKFINLIKHYGLEKDSKNVERGFHIIAWTTEKEEGSERWHLRKLFPEYSRESRQKKEDFDCLRKYLFLFDHSKQTFESIRKSILNGIVRILRIENISVAENPSKKFRKSTFIQMIKSKGDEYYESFKIRLYGWCYSIIVEKNYETVFTDYSNFVINELGDLIPNFRITNSGAFISKEFEYNITELAEHNEVREDNDVSVKLGSIHSVKGQTHCATMYIETEYYTSEIDKLNVFVKGTRTRPDFIGKNPLFFQEQDFSDLKKTRSNEALKMMYVGFSRPTDLLCFAVRKEKVEEYIDKFTESGWNIVSVDD